MDINSTLQSTLQTGPILLFSIFCSPGWGHRTFEGSRTLHSDPYLNQLMSFSYLWPRYSVSLCVECPEVSQPLSSSWEPKEIESCCVMSLWGSDTSDGPQCLCLKLVTAIPNTHLPARTTTFSTGTTTITGKSHRIQSHRVTEDRVIFWYRVTEDSVTEQRVTEERITNFLHLR